MEGTTGAKGRPPAALHVPPVRGGHLCPSAQPHSRTALDTGAGLAFPGLSPCAVLHCVLFLHLLLLIFLTVQKQSAVREPEKCESRQERPGGVHGHPARGLEARPLPQRARCVLPTRSLQSPHSHGLTSVPKRPTRSMREKTNRLILTPVWGLLPSQVRYLVSIN